MVVLLPFKACFQWCELILSWHCWRCCRLLPDRWIAPKNVTSKGIFTFAWYWGVERGRSSSYHALFLLKMTVRCRKMKIIEVNNLSKEYKYFEKTEGLKGAVKSLFKRETKIKRALTDFSFSMEEEVTKHLGTLFSILHGFFSSFPWTACFHRHQPWNPFNHGCISWHYSRWFQNWLTLDWFT